MGLSPFRNWRTADYLLVGLAALILSMFARHVLHSDLGYDLLSWPGSLFVGFGLFKILRGDD